MVGTADSVLFREVSLFRVSFIEKFHCIQDVSTILISHERCIQVAQMHKILQTHLLEDEAPDLAVLTLCPHHKHVRNG